ncbi:MAG: winged helix-turn-helix domain-containing protein [Steroidobacteraceae bacterium]
MAALQYEFDSFRLDPQQRVLFTLQDDRQVELQPRVFDALLYFVERPGELLGKRELLQALWPNVVVEENSLNQVVSQLRRALGERPAEHRYIVTAPGRGYRFVAAVSTARERPVAPRQRHPLSVAVLPFASHMAGGDDLGDAIAADLSRLLSARSRLRVAAHTSTAALRAQQTEPRQIGEVLNVSRIVTGEVEGNVRQLSMSARLLDTATASVLWSQTLRGGLSGLAELQGEMARALAQVIDPEGARPASTAAEVAPEAYLAYLKALSLSQKPSPVSVASSISLLQQSVRLSPQFPRAHSLLAIQYTMGVMFGFGSADALQNARDEAAAALTLDDQNGETYCAAGVIDCLGGNWPRAEERFRIAHSLTADPVVSGLRCAYLTLSVGQLARAMQQAEYTLNVAPTHPIGVQMLASLHMTLGGDEQARRFTQLSIEQGQPPAVAPLNDLLSQLALRGGHGTEAVVHMRAALPPRIYGPELDAVLTALCRDGLNGAERWRVAQQVQGIVAGLSNAELDPPMRKRLLLWYARVDALDAAFALANASLDHFGQQGTVGGAWGLLWLPEMQAFRDDARFQLFARRLRLFDYWMEYGPPDGYSLAGERLMRAG